MAHEISSNGKVRVLDITVFLWHARCLAALWRPIVRLGTTIHSIVSWRYPKSSFIIWLLINSVTVVIPTGYSLMVFIIFLSLVTALGLLHHRTGIFVKFFPNGNLETCALQTSLQISMNNEQKILQEYRNVLVQIDEIMVAMKKALDCFYDVLKWKNPILSTSMIAAFGLGAILLHFTDLSIFCFAFNNAVFLGSGIYMQRIRVPSNEMSESELNVNLDPGLTCGDVDFDNLESDITDSLIGEEEDTAELVGAKQLDGNVSAAKYRTNVVRKIMELRRRPQQGGTCTGCQAAFISILKRKYICCNCGNNFCSRCCSLKVPKSFLGVTAPTTKNDTVLLCAVCHCHLSTKKSS